MIRDNATGIPDEVKAKIFNPFFTTKPAGEGTGLGLSLSHDIVVKQHGGTLEVSTEPGAYTLLGSAVDDDGNIINPQRVDWESGAAFVTPPHLWHGHYNDSHRPAKVMAVQDAGFYEHLRTLNITFTGARSSGVEYKA